jgi:hypothetical protein
MSFRLRFLFVFAVLGGLAGVGASPGALAQSAADTSAIRRAALDYIEGYYAADAERMERALHPALRKRMVYTHPKTGADSLNRQDARTLIRGTRNRSPTPEAKRRAEVTVLDVYKDAASVRVDAAGWVDYLHVAQWRGDWKIINVLWELRRSPAASR